MSRINIERLKDEETKQRYTDTVNDKLKELWQNDKENKEIEALPKGIAERSI